MDRETFKIWIDEMYQRQGLSGMTAVEQDVEYELLNLDEEGPTGWTEDDVETELNFDV